MLIAGLYHTKQQLGTTTCQLCEKRYLQLYHTKQQLGTTTNRMKLMLIADYIIPNNNWELQPSEELQNLVDHYIIPNNNWELQQYQERNFR